MEVEEEKVEVVEVLQEEMYVICGKFDIILARAQTSMDIDIIYECINDTIFFDHIFQRYLLSTEKCVEKTIKYTDKIKNQITHHLASIQHKNTDRYKFTQMYQGVYIPGMVFDEY